MAISKFEDINEVILNHNITIISQLEEDLLCGICRSLLKEPYVTLCECIYCNQCIDNYLSSGIKNCPGTKKECKDMFLDRNTNLYFDPKTNIKIGRLMAKCPNELCSTEVTLGNMKQHIRVCENRQQSCPYYTIGCSDTNISHKTVGAHLRDNLLNHSNMLIEHINHMNNDIDAKNQTFEERLVSIQEQIESLREKRRQPSSNIKCYCIMGHSFKIDIGKLQQEVTRERVLWFSNAVVVLVLSFIIMSISGNNIEKRNEDQFKTHRSLLNNFNEELMNADGKYIWKIDNLMDKLNDSTLGKGQIVESNHFYSHRNGYKLKLQLHSKGDASEVYVSVTVVMTVGPYDDLLAWPFEKRIQINFFDPITKENTENTKYIMNTKYSRYTEDTENIYRPFLIPRATGTGNQYAEVNFEPKISVSKYSNVYIVFSLP